MTTIACLFVCLAMSEVSDTAVTPFCRDYNMILSQTLHGFRRFRGAIQKGDDQKTGTVFGATLSLPGASCNIEETKYRHEYKCHWPQKDIDDWQGTVAQARALATALADCSHGRMDEVGNLANEADGLRWRALLRRLPFERTKVEVTAKNYPVRDLRTPRLAGINLSISYRRVIIP